MVYGKQNAASQIVKFFTWDFLLEIPVQIQDGKYQFIRPILERKPPSDDFNHSCNISNKYYKP